MNVRTDSLGMPELAGRPWYREPWPWLLMAGPVAVIVAGVITVWMAIRSSDGLVVDDYYKQGLAINQTISRDRVAAERGYSAAIGFSGAGTAVSVRLDGSPGQRIPGGLALRVLHPTRAGQDRLILLRRDSSGAFTGIGKALESGRWNLVLEDRSAEWRLTGSFNYPVAGSVILTPVLR